MPGHTWSGGAYTPTRKAWPSPSNFSPRLMPGDKWSYDIEAYCWLTMALVYFLGLKTRRINPN